MSIKLAANTDSRLNETENLIDRHLKMLEEAKTPQERKLIVRQMGASLLAGASSPCSSGAGGLSLTAEGE